MPIGDSGPACYEVQEPHPGISPLSRYGDRVCTRSYPRYYPRRLHAPVGLHRFEPVEWNGIASAPGNVTYPTRNFARFIPQVSRWAGLYLDPHRLIRAATWRILFTPATLK